MKMFFAIPRLCRGIFLFLLLITSDVFANDMPGLSITGPSVDRYAITEKTSMRQRLNGRYQGFVYEETRGSLTRISENRYEGTFYRLQSMTRDLKHIARMVDDMLEVRVSFDAAGKMQTPADAEYPQLRNFPMLPADAVSPGDSWISEGVRLVDPQRRGGTRVPFLCEYTYIGTGDYAGEEAYIIKAQYAVRYERGSDPYGDPQLSLLHGKHLIDIYLPVDPKSSRKAFMRDVVEEQYGYADGQKLERSGFILTWFDHYGVMDKNSTKKAIQDVVRENKIPEVEVEIKEEGVAVSFRNLRFYPDSPRLLPGEEDRINKIAGVLKQQNDRSFLVIGHTANVGSVESQLTLSVERAKTIVDLLVEEGISADKFLYRGVGGSQPIGPNDTEAGRALNRRVEIVILEH